MRFFFRPLLLIAAWGSLLPFSARAAQDAQVIVDLAHVYAAPSESSRELELLPKGTVLRISSAQRKGWYKVILPGRQPVTFGWVARESVRADTLTTMLDAAGIQRYSGMRSESGRARFVITAGARGIYLSPQELQALTGTASGGQLGLGFGAEAGYRLNTQVTLGGRFVSNSVSQVSGADTYSLSLTGFGLFVEWTYMHSLPFKAGLSVGAGILSASATGEAGGSAFQAESASSLISVPAKFTFHWYPLDSLALVLGMGYQYVTSPASLTTSGSGTLEVNASAPFLDAGLQVEF